MKICVNLWCLPGSFLEWDMFQKNVVEKLKIHILYPVDFFQTCGIYEIVWKNMVEPDQMQMTVNIVQ